MKQIPSIEELSMFIDKEEHIKILFSSLPNLKSFNGQKVTSYFQTTKNTSNTMKSNIEISAIVDLDNEEINNISFKNEIHFINEAYKKVSENLKRNKINDNFKEEFQKFLKNEINKININENNAPNYLYATNILESQLSTYSFLYEKFLSILEKKEENHLVELSKLLHENISKSYLMLIKIIYLLYPKISTKTEILKNKLDQALNYVKSVEKEINTFEIKVDDISREKDKEIHQLKEENEYLTMKLQKSEKENQLMLEKIMNDAKKIIEQNETPSMRGNKEEEKKQEENSNYNHNVVPNQISLLPSNSKIISIRNVKETIKEIYISKRECDKTALENKLPKETLEQHMYSYINQKYGLKQLMIEFTSNFMKGVTYYANEDNEIFLFFKILKNEIEEDYKVIIDKFKETIEETLTSYLKVKFPYKTQKEILSIQKEKIHGYLSEDEWKKIIGELLNEEELEFIEKKMYELSSSTNKKIKNAKQKKKMTREEIINLTRSHDENKIAYVELEHALVEMKIKKRDNYLRNFVILFRKFDQDYDGILTEEEFIKMIYTANIFGTETQEKIIDYLKIIDPNNHQQIIFSDCINLFSSQYFQNLPVMDILSSKVS